jgi:hypothetical protein
MNGQEVARARIALNNEIDRITVLANSLNFQEAEEDLPKVEELYEQLAKVINQKSEVHKTIIQNCRIKLNILYQNVDNGLRKREAGKKEDGNIAFKCNWNDKNYQGICSEDAYQYNQIYGGPWCLLSRCRQFVNLPTPPYDCCYESRALIDCNFGAGWDHGLHGEPIRPRKIISAKLGKIALLTTQVPDSQNRFVVGAFNVTKLVEDPGKETFLYGDKETVLDDMLKYEIRFWDHHKNPHNPHSQAWATGLFRYVSDISVLGILEEYIDKKRIDGGNVVKAELLVEVLRSAKLFVD